MVTQRLAALRSHGSRFGIWKAIKPRYLPVLENTCPQPTSVKERLSPRLYSPGQKHEKIPTTHPLAMRTNRRTDRWTERTDGYSAPDSASPATVSRLGVYLCPFPPEITPFFLSPPKKV